MRLTPEVCLSNFTEDIRTVSILSLTRQRLIDLLPEYSKGQLGSRQENDDIFMAQITSLELVGDRLVIHVSSAKRKLRRGGAWEGVPGAEFNVDLLPDCGMYGHEIDTSTERRVYLLGVAGEAFFLQHPSTPYLFDIPARRRTD